MPANVTCFWAQEREGGVDRSVSTSAVTCEQIRLCAKSDEGLLNVQQLSEAVWKT